MVGGLSTTVEPDSQGASVLPGQPVNYRAFTLIAKGKTYHNEGAHGSRGGGEYLLGSVGRVLQLDAILEDTHDPGDHVADGIGVL